MCMSKLIPPAKAVEHSPASKLHARLMDANDARRAGGIDRYAGTVEVEGLRDTVGGDTEGTAGI